MALNRRNFMLALPGCAVLAGGCASAVTSHGPVHPYRELTNRAAGADAKGTVLVCMPETSQTKEVWTGLSDELERDFGLIALKVEGRHGTEAISEAVRRHRPSGVVLMNNPTVLAYREFQRRAEHSPPAVIVMTSFLDGNPRNVSRATGISYEVPLITVVTNLRRLIASPIDRVGVVLRTPLRGFVQRQAELARQEQIGVVSELVGMEPNPAELRRALRRLKQRAHAIWVLNDDRLLTPRLISEGWLPELNERPFAPAIVGAASLVSPEHSFGTFAVLPDHTALGAQAASMVFDLADNRWSLDDTRVQLPLSTTTTMDLTQVRERFELRKDALALVDHILE
ncbi:MAG: hypothetical protein ACOY0T_37970 [Myxococcota bacterium]